MTPDRRKALAELAVVVAQRYRDRQGEPAPHDLPLGVATVIVDRLEQAWSERPSEIVRLKANINAGIER